MIDDNISFMEENNNIEQKTETVAADNLSFTGEEREKTECEISEFKEDSSAEVIEPIPSSKPQAVLDELNKLKTVIHDNENSPISTSQQEEAFQPALSLNVSSSNSIEIIPENIVDNALSIKETTTSVVNSSVVTSDGFFISSAASSEDQEKVALVVNSVVSDSDSSTNVEEVSNNKIESETLADNKSIPSKEYDTDSQKECSTSESSVKRYFNLDFWKSFFFDIVFLLFCMFLTFVLIQKWFSSQEAKILGTNQVHSSLESGEKTAIGNINILVMGIDSVEGTHRSDTIFVLGVNPSKGKITMLSVPRDTRVIIENKARKINEILPRYGEPTLRKILEDLLKINISRKIEVGFESFIEVIDAIGGVDINIEKAMNYDDNWGNLHIHFKPGINHLDGQDALRYVRFRKDAMADLGRIKRQQDFVKAVLKKIMSPTSIVRLPNIIEKAFSHIKTDFTLQEVLTLAKGFNSMDVKIRTMSVPGEARYVDKISYFMPYSEEAISIGSNFFSDLAIFEIEKNYEADRIMPMQSKSDRKNK